MADTTTDRLAYPLLVTKFYQPPARPGRLSRPRLIAALSLGQDHRLTLICAPAGFGKTTLVSEWIAQRALASAWLTLDEQDNDPVRFWMHLTAAVQRLQAGAGANTISLLRSGDSNLLAPAVNALITELTSILETFILVLDDYHFIQNPAVHQGVMRLLDYLPPSIQLVITSRSDPPLALARLRARGELFELRAGDLAFTAEEAAAFLNQVMKLELSEAEVEVLEGRTEGWIAGLQMAALSLKGHSDPGGFVSDFAGSHRYIFDFLIQEIFQAQPAHIQRFLLSTSILDRLCASLCSALTGDEDSQEILETLERENLYLTPLDDHRRWFRYHALFADVLRLKLASASQEELAALHNRASAWYEVQGFSVEAVHHALEAGSMQRASALIENYMEGWRNLGEHAGALSWLERLPVEAVASRPRLAIQYADLLLDSQQMEAARRWLRRAEILSPLAEQGFYGELLAVRASAAYREGKFTEAVELCERALTALPDERRATRARALLILGNASYWSGNPQASRLAYEQAAALARQEEDWHTALNASGNLALVTSLQGDLIEAARAYRSTLEEAAEHQVESIPVTASIYSNLADLAYEWNDLAGFETYHQEAVRRADLGGSPIQRFINQCRWIKYLLARGDISRAEAEIDRAQRFAEKHGVSVSYHSDLNLYRMKCWLYRGELPAVLEWAENSGIEASGELSLAQETNYLARAEAYLHQDRAPEAVSLLQRLLSAAREVGRGWVQIELRARLALALERAGQVDEAQAELLATLKAAEPQGYLRSFLDSGEQLLPLLQRAWRSLATNGPAASRLKAYTARLIEAFTRPGVSPAPASGQPPEPPDLPEPLSERELEILRYIAQGFSNREISERLYISVSTVKTHINNLYAKLSAGNRVQALSLARRYRLIPD